MRIKFAPIADLPHAPRSLKIVRAGDALTINGDTLDFSSIPDGAALPQSAIPCEWITGPVERVDGVLIVPMLLPYLGRLGLDFRPADLVDPPDGPVTLPAPEPEEDDAND